MNDDRRLQIDLQQEDDARALSGRLEAEQLEHELSDAFHDRVVVSRHGARVFLYADPDEPLPEDDAARPAEHEAPIARERAETARTGHSEFEVRVDLPSRHDAVRFSERLEREAPPGSKVEVEGTWAAAYGERPPNPFAVLGGLGG